MIEFATAVPPPPAKGAAAQLAAMLGGDFQRALSEVGDGAAKPQPALIRLLEKGIAKVKTTDLSPPADPAPFGLAEIDPQVDLPILSGMPDKRQPVAENGKPLPVDPLDKDMSKDMIWLLTGMIPAPVIPVVASPKLAVTLPPVVVDGVPAPYAPPAPAGVQLDGAIGEPLPSPGLSPAPSVELTSGVTIGTDKQGSTLAAVGLAPGAAKADPPPRSDAGVSPNRIDVATTPAAAAVQPAGPITQPAGQAFAAAIAAVVQSRRESRDPVDPRTPLNLATATLEAIHKPAVAPAADAQHGTLDLRQDRGLQGMIDRIETLRDDVDSRDTRIRLVPDALGTVDVSVRKDGERVHVHFAAENQASARLLSDAQPRLAELAEARGVRLGQTSVDTGTGQPRQHRPAPPIPAAPALRSGIETTDIADHRIA